MTELRLEFNVAKNIDHDHTIRFVSFSRLVDNGDAQIITSRKHKANVHTTRKQDFANFSSLLQLLLNFSVFGCAAQSLIPLPELRLFLAVVYILVYKKVIKMRQISTAPKTAYFDHSLSGSTNVEESTKISNAPQHSYINIRFLVT
jgi:hypothetical protein